VPDVVVGTIHCDELDTVQAQNPDVDVVAVTVKLPPSAITLCAVSDNV
jgi:hypothetical protein